MRRNPAPHSGHVMSLFFMLKPIHTENLGMRNA